MFGLNMQSLYEVDEKLLSLGYESVSALFLIKSTFIFLIAFPKVKKSRNK